MKKQIALVCGLLCAALLVFGLVGTANAATVVLNPLDVGDDAAAGIRGLQVGNTLYNMAFIRGRTVEQVYGQFPGVFPFPDSISAAAAIDAVNDVLNDYNLLNDPDVTSVNSGQGDGSRSFLLPFASQMSPFPGQETARVWRSGYDGIFGGPPDTWGSDTAGPFAVSYSDFTSTYAAFRVVPLPAGVWLLGSGLVGVIGLRRKRPKT